LRGEAEARLSSADGAQRQLGHALMSVRNKIVDAIDEASPKIEGKGTYEPALSKFRDEKNISEAFFNGYSNIFSNSKKLENLPEFTKEWLDGLSVHEKEAAKEGARTAIRMQMGQARNAALAGVNFAKSDFSKEKLQMLLGKEEANSLISKLEAEAKIANSHVALTGGSQTAMREAAQSKRDLPLPTKPNEIGRIANIASYVGPELANYYGTGYAIPGLGLAASLASHGATTAVRKSSDAIKLALAKEGNRQYAKMALPTQGPERQELINALERAIPGPKPSLVTRASSLARLVGP